MTGGFMIQWLMINTLLVLSSAYSQVPQATLVPQRPDINGIVVLPDGRKCRGVVEMNAQGKEYTRLIECEGGILKVEPPQSQMVEANTKKARVFDLEDGEAHYAVKLSYSFDPKAAFQNVSVNSAKTKADTHYTQVPSIEFEYGFYNKYAWNLLAGAGLDFQRTSMRTLYNNAGLNSTLAPPKMRFTSLNIYLNIFRAFERFYIQIGGTYAIPQIEFDRATSSQGAGGLGYRFEVGYSINKRWAIYGNYREFGLSYTAMDTSSNKYAFNDGKYSDYILGARYIFR